MPILLFVGEDLFLLKLHAVVDYEASINNKIM